MKSFASDNYSGIHPEILEAIQYSNTKHEISYGEDSFTAIADKKFEEVFGKVKVHYAFNGTGANVIAIKCCVQAFEAVLCASTAHINADECGAPTQSTGSSLITIATKDGKLTPELIAPYMKRKGNVHNTQPKLISISQSTELGTIYSLQELRKLCDFAHANDLYVHLDGARISNAVATLGVSMKEATIDCGVDIMSFGGTKNGLMIGEAILIFNDELKKNSDYYQKQTAQLFSKNRFMAVQFSALLNNNLWLKMAKHSNAMAALLASKLKEIPEVKITQKVEANAVFVIIPKHAIVPLQEKYRFYVWDEESLELRWMCSFDTTENEVNDFIKTLKQLL
jgi:threonine aldolase